MQSVERMIDIPESVPWTPYLQRINQLFIDEKQARHDADAAKLILICNEIVNLSFAEKEYKYLREFIVSISKKRNQAKKAIIEMVNLTMKLNMEIEKKERFQTWETLREITEGKLFLEAEYARCTKSYCDMIIENNDLEKASEIIQEVQIETYGAIDKKEKIDYILYQVSVMLLKKDFVRTYILTKKIDPLHLNDKGLEQQKIKYYQLVIQYYLHEKMYQEVANSFKVLYDTLRDHADMEEKYKLKQTAFCNYILFLLLSPYSNQKVDFLNISERFYKKELEAIPLLNEAVRGFLTKEVIPLHPEKLWENFQLYEPFSKTSIMPNTAFHFECLQKEIIHHNLKVVEGYYSRITMKRLAELCNASPEAVETEIAEMVYDGRMRAKIDRIQGIIDFRRQMQPHDCMNDWGADIKTLLELVEETCHLINRENVIHGK